ncbi:hypothetical protein A3710_04020 [Stutzerimonas frequens]|nr:hypothetical protein A3710_04020 [Stutzerimonas frequens]
MPGYLTNSKNHANEQRHTYSAIGQAVGVHLRTVPHWVAAGEPQGKEVSIEGGQRGAPSLFLCNGKRDGLQTSARIESAENS